MNLEMPQPAAGSTYQVIGPRRCISDIDHNITVNGKTIDFAYNPDCEGSSVHLSLYAKDITTGVDRYIDLGALVLHADASQSVTAGYQVAPRSVLQLANLPTGTTAVQASVVARAGLDVTTITAEAAVAPAGNAATISALVVPGGNAVRVSSHGFRDSTQASDSDWISPPTVGPTTVVDGAAMLPLYESLAVGQPGVLQWSGRPSGGTLVIASWSDRWISWRALLDPEASEARFPSLPADLGIPAPVAPFTASVTKLDVPGLTTDELARTVTWRLSSWPYDSQLLPPEGGAMARIRFAASGISELAP